MGPTNIQFQFQTGNAILWHFCRPHPIFLFPKHQNNLKDGVLRNGKWYMGIWAPQIKNFIVLHLILASSVKHLTFTSLLTRFRRQIFVFALFPNFDRIFAKSDRNLLDITISITICSASKNFNNLSSSWTKIGNYQKYL